MSEEIVATEQELTQEEKEDLKSAGAAEAMFRDYYAWVNKELEWFGPNQFGKGHLNYAKHWATDPISGEVAYRPVKKAHRPAKQKKVIHCPHCGKSPLEVAA